MWGKCDMGVMKFVCFNYKLMINSGVEVFYVDYPTMEVLLVALGRS